MTRPALLVALLAASFAPACATGLGDVPSNPRPTDAGSDGAVAATSSEVEDEGDGGLDAFRIKPRAFVDLRFAPGFSGTTSSCPTWATRLSVGTTLVSVQDGDPLAGHAEDRARITCKVAALGPSFDVSADVGEQDKQGGRGLAVLFDGTFSRNGASLLTARFESGTGDALVVPDCSVSFSTTAGQGIAAGRVWGTLACRGACDVDGVIKLENCAQR